MTFEVYGGDTAFHSDAKKRKKNLWIYQCSVNMCFKRQTVLYTGHHVLNKHCVSLFCFGWTICKMITINWKQQKKCDSSAGHVASALVMLASDRFNHSAFEVNNESFFPYRYISLLLSWIYDYLHFALCNMALSDQNWLKFILIFMMVNDMHLNVEIKHLLVDFWRDSKPLYFIPVDYSCDVFHRTQLGLAGLLRRRRQQCSETRELFG